MKEQAQLREEMAYQYKIGNFEVRITNLSCLGAMLNHVLDFICIIASLFVSGCRCYSEKVGP